MYNKELFAITNFSQINELNHFSDKGDSPICRFGQEDSNFINISAAAFNENGYVFDTIKNSFFVYNSVLNTWTRLNELDFSNVTDCFIQGNILFIVESHKAGYSIVDLEKLLGKPNYILSSKKIEFQNSSGNYLTERLYIWSTNGLPLKGTVNSSHDGISVEPNEFFENDVYLRIKIDKDKVSNTESIMESISINLDGEEAINIPVKGYISEEKNNFAVKNDSNATINSSSNLVLTIETNSSFDDTLSVDIIKTYENYAFSSGDVEIKEKSKNVHSVLKFSPKTNIKPGFYPVDIRVTSKKYKIIKQYSFMFRYEQNDLVKKTLLGELFTAPWCEYCQSAERGIEELHKILDTDDICFVTYFIECVQDEQLCTHHTKARKLWYDVTGTPTILFNGTEKKIGGIKSKTESMIHEYLPIVKNLQSQNSCISLSTWANIIESKDLEADDPEKKTIKVSSHIESLKELPKESNLSFYSILIENNVIRPHKEKNSEGELVEVSITHNYVFRTMNDSMGQTLNSGKTIFGYNKNTCVISTDLIVPDYVNLENCFVVTFVQDNTTKETLQNRVVSIENTSENQNATIASMQKSIVISDEKEFHAYFQITNANNQYSKFIVAVEPIDSIANKPLEVYLNGDLLIDNVLELNPFQTKQIEITGNVSDLKNTSALKVRIENSNMIELQASVVPFKSYTKKFAKIISPSSENLVTNKRPMFLIQTIPGTQLMGGDNKVASTSGPDGIICFTPKVQLGTNNLVFNLRFPNFPEGGHTSLKYSFFLFKEVVLTLGSNTYVLNDVEEELSSPIVVVKGRTLTNLMFVQGIIECNIEWDGVTKTVRLYKNDHVLTMKSNENEVFLDGGSHTIDVPPSIYDGNFYCPLRFVVESFEFNISWNPVTHEIKITNLEE
jgi:thiol-disulfide isomerase/thioredoxin